MLRKYEDRRNHRIVEIHKDYASDVGVSESVLRVDSHGDCLDKLESIFCGLVAALTDVIEACLSMNPCSADFLHLQVSSTAQTVITERLSCACKFSATRSN